VGAPTIDTTNYSNHQLYGYNGSVTSAGFANTAFMFAGSCLGASATADAFGAGVIDILDPFETSKYLTTRALAGSPGGTGTNAVIGLESGSWRNTAAIDTIQVYPAFDDFAAKTRVSLYGLKGTA
jgi:hypothetical protein